MDPQYKIDRKIAAQLPRAWDAFFGRYGRLTEIQRRAVPVILTGKDVVLCSATASGKTEAACAPLIETNLRSNRANWTILYVSPTRALVNDLYARLESPAAVLGLDTARRTGDHPAQLRDQPNILLTTPESLDSMLCRGRLRSHPGHVLASVTAVVLDEIHLLHGSPRGEMLRWLLHRLRLLKKYALSENWTNSDHVQIVALSATLSNPDTVVQAYLTNGCTVRVPGSRQIEVVAEGDPTERCLPAYIRSLSRPEKILVFCNSRKRADTLASQMADLLHEQNYSVSVHHGSLARDLREEAEEKFHREKRIVVFATSTLELGIDIGDIDLVVLDGAPPDVNSLLQRIGRGNRRNNKTRVMACSADSKDRLCQSALMAAARQSVLNDPYRGPHHSVALQQVASYVFQAPERVRKHENIEVLLRLCGDKSMADHLVPHMLEGGELVEKRDGLALGYYWIERTDLGKIHSVIESSAGTTLIDEKTGATIAEGIDYRGGNRIRMLGREFDVKAIEHDNRVVVGQPGKRSGLEAQWSYASSGRGKPQAPAREIRAHLGFPENHWVLHRRQWLFHFGGAAREEIISLLAPSRESFEKITGLYIKFQSEVVLPISWLAAANAAAVYARLPRAIDSIERKLGLPYASKRLPLPLRVDQAARWLTVEAEVLAVRTFEVIHDISHDQADALDTLL